MGNVRWRVRQALFIGHNKLMHRTIYGLYYFEPGATPTKRYFYVGRSIDMFQRERQHHYAKKSGHEDKYEFIRDLESRGIMWHAESLREIPENEYPPDNESWFVIKLTREGHNLTNMRHGSEEHRRELAEQVGNIAIRSAADVQAVRVKRKYAKSRALRRRMLEQALRKEGIPDVTKDGLLPPILKRRLLTKGCLKVEKGVTLTEIIKLERAEPMFKRLEAKSNGVV